VCDAMARRQRLHHVALNTAKLINMRSDPELAADVKSSDIVGIDGAGIVLALRVLGLPTSDRVAGIDLMAAVLEACARQGFRPYFLGAAPAVVVAAADKIKATYPGLEIAGMRDGYFKPHEEANVVAEIKASRADCLFVGMPTPRKERFLAAHRDALDVPFIMGVGGSFDIWAGLVKRAPLLMQRTGFEWLYRVYQEPGRMWWRYARTNTLFAVLLAKTLLRRRGSLTTRQSA
jgi:N-acetylglucosaminyldiphosphoundecaprenol N-acetyl-beta-D-mannosaminyltransferase